jgi:predicted Zn-dependent protease
LGFRGDILMVDGVERLQCVVDALTVSVGGFDDDTLFLGWSDRGVDYSVVIANAGMQSNLAVIAPPTLRVRLRRGRTELNYHRKKWNAVLATLGTLALGALVAWWQSDAVVGWVVGRVSIKTEERLGKIMLGQLEAQGDIINDGPAYDAVKSIGTRVTAGSHYQYQWFIKDSAEINAFAAPSGIVVVTSGLIKKATSAEELAGVLAHESQHVELRHTLKQMIHTAGWAVVLAVALGDVSAITTVFIHQVGTLRNSRKLEGEADAEGAKVLVRSSISPAGLHSFFDKLLAEQEKAGEVLNIALLSSHPATRDRITNIDRLVRTLHCDCKPLGYDWKTIQASLEKAPERR